MNNATTGNFCDAILNVLTNPVLVVGQDNKIIYANYSGQDFFQAGLSWFKKHYLDDIMPFGSPVLSLLPQVRERNGPINEYKIDIGTPRTGGTRVVDCLLYTSPSPRDS